MIYFLLEECYFTVVARQWTKGAIVSSPGGFTYMFIILYCIFKSENFTVNKIPDCGPFFKH
jgi:hypothetical protein